MMSPSCYFLCGVLSQDDSCSYCCGRHGEGICAASKHRVPSKSAVWIPWYPQFSHCTKLFNEMFCIRDKTLFLVQYIIMWSVSQFICSYSVPQSKCIMYCWLPIFNCCHVKLSLFWPFIGSFSCWFFPAEICGGEAVPISIIYIWKSHYICRWSLHLFIFIFDFLYPSLCNTSIRNRSLCCLGEGSAV